jgi:hypothetical protein
MRHISALFLAAALLMPRPALAGPGAEPAPPAKIDAIAALELGVFCAYQSMDRAPAPGTATGWIHVPREDVAFHWPEVQVVPATLGIAFGVKATGARGWATAVGEARVYRPGSKVPEMWASDISEHGGTIAFFRFDRPDELITGTWAIEGWDRGQMLYRVEFRVVPPGAAPGIAGACDATS